MPVIEPFCVIGELLVKRRLKTLQVLLDLVERDSGANARDHLVVVAIVTGVFGAQLQGFPDVGRAEDSGRRLGSRGKASRHYTDDGEGLLVNTDGAADNGGIAIKHAGIESLAQNGSPAATGAIFLRRKGTTENRHGAERAEVSLRYTQRVD